MCVRAEVVEVYFVSEISHMMRRFRQEGGQEEAKRLTEGLIERR